MYALHISILFKCIDIRNRNILITYKNSNVCILKRLTADA